MSQDVTLITSSFSLSSDGLRIHGAPTFDEWVDCGKALKGLVNAVQFAIGDWLNYGQDHFGERCAQALEAYELHTLANFAYVARRVTAEVRRPDLPYSHHAEVAVLDREEQVEVLEMARANDWTVRDVRAEVRNRRNGVVPKEALVRVWLTKGQIEYLIGLLETAGTFEASEILEILQEAMDL